MAKFNFSMKRNPTRTSPHSKSKNQISQVRPAQSSATPLAGFNSNSQVIYEVQLVTPRILESRFETWLVQHLADMLQSPGFMSAEALRLELHGDEASWLYRCTYIICDEAHLQRYFSERAPQMRADGPARFGQDLKILSRRTWSLNTQLDSATCIGKLESASAHTPSTSDKTESVDSTSTEKSASSEHGVARRSSMRRPETPSSSEPAFHSKLHSNFDANVDTSENLSPTGVNMPNGISTRLNKIRNELQRLSASAQIDKLRSELQRLTNEIVKRGEAEVAQVEKTVKQVKRRVTKLQSQIEAEVGKLSQMVSRLPRQSGFAKTGKKARGTAKSAGARRQSNKRSTKRRASAPKSKKSR